MIIKLLVELDYDAEIMHSGDKCEESKQWFMEEILSGDKGLLLLHSNQIGDTVGKVTVIDNEPKG